MNNRNSLIVAGGVGFLTGAVVGAIVSPIVFHLYGKSIKQSSLRWLAWAATGIVAAPICIALQTPFLSQGEAEVQQPEPTQLQPIAAEPIAAEPIAAEPIVEPSIEPSVEPSPIVPLNRTEEYRASLIWTGLDFQQTFSGNIRVDFEGDEPIGFEFLVVTSPNLPGRAEHLFQYDLRTSNGVKAWKQYGHEGIEEEDPIASIDVVDGKTIITIDAIDDDGSILIKECKVWTIEADIFAQ
ncbi:hypothetical protein [Egbenema bharatensis]|uniref:hypothetical protein n=1 Tax=Egbenema bharatensis TaxID=3463334 RepID=UPI003A89FDD8